MKFKIKTAGTLIALNKDKISNVKTTCANIVMSVNKIAETLLGLLFSSFIEKTDAVKYEDTKTIKNDIKNNIYKAPQLL